MYAVSTPREAPRERLCLRRGRHPRRRRLRWQRRMHRAAGVVGLRGAPGGGGFGQRALTARGRAGARRVAVASGSAGRPSGVPFGLHLEERGVRAVSAGVRAGASQRSAAVVCGSGGARACIRVVGAGARARVSQCSAVAGCGSGVVAVAAADARPRERSRGQATETVKCIGPGLTGPCCRRRGGRWCWLSGLLSLPLRQRPAGHRRCHPTAAAVAAMFRA